MNKNETELAIATASTAAHDLKASIRNLRLIFDEIHNNKEELSAEEKLKMASDFEKSMNKMMMNWNTYRKLITLN